MEGMVGWLCNLWSGFSSWSGWDAAQSTEFTGAIIGAALSVGLGFYISDRREQRRGSDLSRHVRSMVIQENLINRTHLIALHVAIHIEATDTTNATIDPVRLVRTAEPRFLDAASSYLLQAPEAVSIVEMKDLQAVRLALAKVQGAWQSLRAAYLFDLESQRGTTQFGTPLSSLATMRVQPDRTNEFGKLWAGCEKSLRAAFDEIINQPPDWMIGPRPTTYDGQINSLGGRIWCLKVRITRKR